MSDTYFEFYKRRIGKDTKEKLIKQVESAHNKGRLTDEEVNKLMELINNNYSSEG